MGTLPEWLVKMTRQMVSAYMVKARMEMVFWGKVAATMTPSSAILNQLVTRHLVSSVIQSTA